jgi:hypothetical protein
LSLARDRRADRCADTIETIGVGTARTETETIEATTKIDPGGA